MFPREIPKALRQMSFFKVKFYTQTQKRFITTVLSFIKLLRLFVLSRANTLNKNRYDVKKLQHLNYQIIHKYVH